jgi:hypothetical protein
MYPTVKEARIATKVYCFLFVVWIATAYGVLMYYAGLVCSRFTCYTLDPLPAIVAVCVHFLIKEIMDNNIFAIAYSSEIQWIGLIIYVIVFFGGLPLGMFLANSVYECSNV